MKYMIGSSLVFWIGWVILPILMEFIPSIGNFFLLVAKKRRLAKEERVLSYPQPVTVIIPVYNSAATLYNCIKSINDSDYSNKHLEIMCVDNGSKDSSFDEFQKAQSEFSNLNMFWMKSAQGKSRALNKAIFNSKGKYIINIDSDGVLLNDAITRIVSKFEEGDDYDCMTGVILIDPALIERTPRGFLRLFRKIEFLEYNQAFLAGRNFQSETNTIFTLSGAFSALRKSTLFKTRMYNSETICEDAHLTFQVKDLLHRKVGLCEDAIFMVDPIDNVNKYYTQRQRWQIGELEVLRMFALKRMRNPINLLLDPTCRLIVQDHTMAFPKFIWLFVMAILAIGNKMAWIVGLSILIVYGLSLISSVLYGFNILAFLKGRDYLRNYYKKNMWYLLFLPGYNLFSFFVRLCGIINSMVRETSWKTLNMTDEAEEVTQTVKRDFIFIDGISNFLRDLLETEESIVDSGKKLYGTKETGYFATVEDGK